MRIESSKEIVKEAYNTNDEQYYWNLISELHRRGTTTEFEIAETLCGSHDPTEREIGADTLGQLGWQMKAFQNESISILIGMLADPVDDVVASAAYALGHRHTTSAIKPLLMLKNHPNPRVRHGVVFGLLGLDDNEAINALIELSKDTDDDVRNWATFGLGSQIDVDTDEIRNALNERLNDLVAEIRGEAFVGLAARGCHSIKDKLIQEIIDDNYGCLVLEAAEILACPDLYQPLKNAHETLQGNESGYFISCLTSALDKCASHENKT